MAQPPYDHWTSLHRILAQEVPEVAAGHVELRAVARLLGRRTKLAVASLAPDVDPVAICVGRQAHHAKAIQAALGGERVDILPWSDEPERLVKFALAPARVRAVELDHRLHRARAYMSTSEFELARGEDDENLTLANQVTGWTVELVASDAT
jgi:transcription termination/antitermination protein NusA